MVFCLILFWILDLTATDSGPVIKNLMDAFKILDLIGIFAFTLTDLLKNTSIWSWRGWMKFQDCRGLVFVVYPAGC